jgi:hypothetical protein
MSPMATEISEQQRVLADYQQVRQFTERLVEPLTPEDCVIQSMPDVSPTRWHLAHTTWFFETFVLARKPGYEAFDPDYAYLFNSYYNSIGSQFPRPRKSAITGSTSTHKSPNSFAMTCPTESSSRSSNWDCSMNSSIRN